MLSVKGYSKSYNQNLVLQIEHAEFGPGVNWIKGDNGSGKTTLFKSICGLLPFDGKIYFDDGVDITKNPISYRERVSYSEAEPLYPGFLTAKDLIRFIGQIKKATISSQNALVEKLGVNSFFEQPCQTYSSGMMKKVSLLMAFLGDPKLIILDEPLITLDEKVRKVIFDLIHEKLNKNEVTFLVSSHQQISPEDLIISQSFVIQNKTLSVL
jgi:ABC-2 type transport system ATP-binding protein